MTAPKAFDDWNPIADEDPTVKAALDALRAFTGAATQMVLANRWRWAERESAFLAAWFDLQGAMVKFTDTAGTRPPPIDAGGPPKRAV